MVPRLPNDIGLVWFVKLKYDILSMNKNMTNIKKIY